MSKPTKDEKYDPLVEDGEGDDTLRVSETTAPEDQFPDEYFDCYNPRTDKPTMKGAILLFMFFLMRIMQQWQIYIIVYSINGDDPYTNVQVELGNFSDTKYGLVAGVAFNIISGVTGLFAGQIADMVNRKWALFIFSLLWSTMTMLMSFAQAYWMLLVPRLLQSFFLSACFPIIFSLISDSFHPKFRARASSIYTLGLYLGVGMSSLSIVIEKQIGWRNTFRMVAGLSYLATLIILLVSEPVRGRFNPKKKNEEEAPAMQLSIL